MKSIYFWNYTGLKNEMHSYKLYNTFSVPQISLVLMIKGKSYNISDIITHLKNIYSTDNITFEIILYIQYLKKKNYFKLKHMLCTFIKNTSIIIYNKKKFINQIFNDIINNIRGTYIFFNENLCNIKNLLFEETIDNIKNKIENYFQLNISSHETSYLIRSKILKNLIDNGNQFFSVQMITKIIKDYPIPQFNYINIAFCLNNNYTSLVYVSMTSILSSKSINTYISFYLVVSYDFKYKNIKFIDSLHEIYEYFNITFIKMDNRYNNAYIYNRITKEAYYRFSLAELIPQINKIIYLDTDIIVYKELSNFYNLNFNGKMILGQPTIGNWRTIKKRNKLN